MNIRNVEHHLSKVPQAPSTIFPWARKWNQSHITTFQALAAGFNAGTVRSQRFAVHGVYMLTWSWGEDEVLLAQNCKFPAECSAKIFGSHVHKSLNYSTAAFSDYVKTNVSAPLKWIDSAKQVKMDIICETNECRLVLSPVLHCLLLLSLLHSTSSTSFFLLCLNNITAASCKHVINRQQEAYLVTPPQAIANFLLLWRHRSSI